LKAFVRFVTNYAVFLSYFCVNFVKKTFQTMSVLVADDSIFETQIAENKLVVVKFYAGWCGSCRLFAPKYKRLAADERFANILFLDVDAEKSPNARNIVGVKTLPYFAIFKDGALVEGLSTSKEEAFVELLEKLS